MGNVDRLLGRVSILVVVERGGGRQATAVDADLGRCFNPCCCGTGGRTCGRPARSSKRRGFNPCCCGTGGRTASWGSSARCIARFQSLLLWNGGADGKPAKRSSASANVSILVVVERGGGREAAWRPPSRPPHVSILVVVERGGGRSHGRGAWRPDRVSILVVVERGGGHPAFTRSSTGGTGFNPCCCGTGGRTRISERIAPRTAMFQSLLLWNGGADKTITHPPSLAVRVSILVVVERGGGQGRARAGDRRMPVSILVVVERGGGRSPACRPWYTAGCFNPCCCGTGGRTTIEPANTILATDVSILVVVERGGGPVSNSTTEGDSAVFQSLLLWNGGADVAVDRRLLRVAPVSILVVVERGGGLLCRKIGEAYHPVSILVVVERGGGRQLARCDCRPAGGFQSLLLWNGGADALRGFADARIQNVSILVVVERGGGPDYQAKKANDAN